MVMGVFDEDSQPYLEYLCDICCQVAFFWLRDFCTGEGRPAHVGLGVQRLPLR